MNNDNLITAYKSEIARKQNLLLEYNKQLENAISLDLIKANVDSEELILLKKNIKLLDAAIQKTLEEFTQKNSLRETLFQKKEFSLTELKKDFDIILVELNESKSSNHNFALMNTKLNELLETTAKTFQEVSEKKNNVQQELINTTKAYDSLKENYAKMMQSFTKDLQKQPSHKLIATLTVKVKDTIILHQELRSSLHRQDELSVQMQNKSRVLHVSLGELQKLAPTPIKSFAHNALFIRNRTNKQYNLSFSKDQSVLHRLNLQTNFVEQETKQQISPKRERIKKEINLNFMTSNKISSKELSDGF